MKLIAPEQRSEAYFRNTANVNYYRRMTHLHCNVLTHLEVTELVIRSFDTDIVQPFRQFPAY